MGGDVSERWWVVIRMVYILNMSSCPQDGPLQQRGGRRERAPARVRGPAAAAARRHAAPAAAEPGRRGRAQGAGMEIFSTKQNVLSYHKLLKATIGLF